MVATDAHDLAALRRSLEERGVKFCLASYVDVHGIPKAKVVPIDHFERMMRGSELFTGAALDGLGQGPGDDFGNGSGSKTSRMALSSPARSFRASAL